MDTPTPGARSSPGARERGQEGAGALPPVAGGRAGRLPGHLSRRSPIVRGRRLCRPGGRRRKGELRGAHMAAGRALLPLREALVPLDEECLDQLLPRRGARLACAPRGLVRLRYCHDLHLQVCATCAGGGQIEESHCPLCWLACCPAPHRSRRRGNLLIRRRTGCQGSAPRAQSRGVGGEPVAPASALAGS
jgi:hypothetical protein